MKKLLFSLFTCALVAVSTTAASADQAPDFTLAGQKGSVSLKDYRGKVVYVDFWASWCTPCRKSFPWMNDMQKRYKSKGLQVIGINLDQERDLAEKFLSANPAQFVVAFDPDGKSAEAYNVKGMPSSYIIDRQGNIVKTHIGFRESEVKEMELELAKALSRL